MEKVGIFGAQSHPELQNRIWQYLKGGHPHSSLLLSGKGEEVKPVLALGIAKFFLCKDRPQDKPFCGQCTGCRRIDRNLHPDVLWNKEQEEAEPIKIETVRNWCHAMELSPMEGRAKICLINHCHQMTVSSANALLKSLEEPGADRYFILMTSQEGSLLPTILSRCLEFHFTGETSLAQPDEHFERPIQEFLQSYDPATIKPLVENKAQCQHTVSFLQTKVRHQLVGQENVPWLGRLGEDAMHLAFESLTQIEGRLRSNANPSLMIENFLRDHL